MTSSFWFIRYNRKFFSPMREFIKVDFPTLGDPIILTKPDLCTKSSKYY